MGAYLPQAITRPRFDKPVRNAIGIADREHGDAHGSGARNIPPYPTSAPRGISLTVSTAAFQRQRRLDLAAIAGAQRREPAKRSRRWRVRAAPCCPRSRVRRYAMPRCSRDGSYGGLHAGRLAAPSTHVEEAVGLIVGLLDGEVGDRGEMRHQAFELECRAGLCRASQRFRRVARVPSRHMPVSIFR